MKHATRILFILAPVLLSVSGAVAKKEAQKKQNRARYLQHELRLACANNDEERGIALLKMGANPNGRDLRGEPLVFWGSNAAQDQSVKLLRAFLRAGANPNAQRPKNCEPPEVAGATPLQELAHHGDDNYEAIEMLLWRKADVRGAMDEATGACGGCGGCWVNPDTVSLLVDHGARLSSHNKKDLLKFALYAFQDNEEGALMQINFWLAHTPHTKKRRHDLSGAIHWLQQEYFLPEQEPKRQKLLRFLQQHISSA